jgi:hypothetical protein
MSDEPIVERGQPDEATESDVEPSGGLPTETTFFYGLGAFSLFLALVYYVTTAASEQGAEYAGVAALVGGGVFSIFFGTFLLLTVRRIQSDVEAMEEEAAEGIHDDAMFMPAESIWPIGIGIGASLVLAGVPLGFWVMIPGIALLVHSTIGFARQSKLRR